MYEYRIIKGMNEARLEYKLNEAAAEGWEVVSYAIRPSGGIWFFVIGLLADHYALLRRQKA